MRNTKGRFLIALVMVMMTLIGYYSSTQTNPVTGQKQQVSLTPEQEITLGLQSAPQLAADFGGLARDPEIQRSIKAVGQRIVQRSDAARSPYTFDFHALADERTVNAFAVPGGQIFITMALLRQLKSEDQLAGVLGHEIGHVVGRHSAAQMAKQEMIQGLAGAASVAMSDPSSPNGSAYLAQYVANLVSMKYGRDDELESDELGVNYMIQAGYQPEALLDVMEILAAASGGSQLPEFSSTHPSPENRKAKIKEAIQKYQRP